MRRFPWFLHPVLIFVFSIVALCFSLFLYIYWYVKVSSGLEAVLSKTDLPPAQFVEWRTWIVILILSLLVGLILTGFFIIFAYQVKTLKLYRRQQNFIDNFTHELKTPVTSLQLYLETLDKHELTRDQQHKYINYMLADVARLTGDINRILNLSRLEAGLFSGEFEPLDLVGVVNRYLEKNHQLFRNGRITVHDPGEPVICPVNESLFEMLLANLLTNAMHYNDSPTPTVDITLAVSRDRVRLLFQDNGIGLAPGEARKIFRKFYQEERPDRLRSGGSGLGLYLVEQIVRQHNGKVRAFSRGVGQGTRFEVLLPLRRKKGTGAKSEENDGNRA